MKKRTPLLLSPLFAVASLFGDAPAGADSPSQADLFEALGQYMTLTSGINEMKLSSEEAERYASGLSLILVDETKLESVTDDELQAAVDDALARLEAAEAGAQTFEALNENTPEFIGYVVALQASLVGMDFAPEEGELIKRGAISGASMDELTPELQAKLDPLSELINERSEALMAKMQAQNAELATAQRAADQAFLSELAEAEENLESTASGLHYILLEEGEGEKPVMANSVLVHYHGTLTDGTVFDSSVQRGQPAEFPLNRVVPGFAEGLQLIAPGGKIRLFIPADLAYGDMPPPQSPILPGSMIIFDCELIEVRDPS